jgi:molybdopterin-containing oxidoreductase family iron-sulfur binding subunit
VPGVISMAIGGGHTHSGRYATGRGANPLEILAFAREEATGALATGATRVRLSRLGESKDLIQYSAKDKEERPHAHR